MILKAASNSTPFLCTHIFVHIDHGDDVLQRECSRENLIFLSVGTSLKLGFCGKPNWAQRLNGNISHNFQCILSGNSNFPTFHRHLGILCSGWISIWAACHIFGKYYIFENEVKRGLDFNGKWVKLIEMLPHPQNITQWDFSKYISMFISGILNMDWKNA